MKVLSIDEAAEAVGVSRRSIYHWIQQGRLEVIKTAGGKTLITEQSLWRTKDGRQWADEDLPTRKANTTSTLSFPGRTLL